MMADNDFNIIKPVEGLQNIKGLSPTKRREQRKPQQQLHGESEEESESTKDELNESADEQELDSELAENQDDQHTIDYRA